MSETFAAVLARLQATIAARKGADPSASYTAQLLADPTRAAKKLGEEAIETCLAAVAEDRPALANESADLLYHLLVLWAAGDRDGDRRHG
jgi:phosphoribosyl-ATP pyrophosphohydrolase